MSRPSRPRPLVDPGDRTVSSLVFTDADLFAREQDAIFRRCWVFLGHESQVLHGGDYVQAFAGTMPLLLCRDAEGVLHAFANVCTHRGARICQQEQGNATKFVCPYHNWAFTNQGNLLAVPRQHSPGFDRSRWNLHKADRVSVYRGLVFCTFSSAAPSLEDYLGEMKWYLDLLLNSSRAGTEVSPGIHRTAVRCNWKIPPEQFGADNWHFQGVHTSMAKLGLRNENPNSPHSFHAWTDEGHMLICVAPRSEVPSASITYLDELATRGDLDARQRRMLGSTLVMTVFPNLSFVYFPGMCSVRVWHPRAPDRTELWSWALYNKDTPASLRDAMRTQVTRLFSPTGMLEQDDLEVWANLENNLKSMPSDFRLCYEFGAGATPPQRDVPGHSDTLQSDTPAFAYYLRWAQLLDAEGTAA